MRQWSVIVAALIVFMGGGIVNSHAQTVELVLRDSAELAFERVYRTQTLALRDPHVFTLVPVFGCSDFTGTPIPTTSLSLNHQIATALTTDGDGDGLIDLSPLLALDLFAPQSSGQMITQVNSLCPVPAPPTLCAIDAGMITPAVASANRAADSCLMALADTTSDYQPAVPVTQAPCFVSAATDLLVPFGNLEIPLSAARTAATWDSEGASLSNGLIRGFLRESDADVIPLPADLPLIGGQPLSSILRGGSGNCATGDDRDVFNDESGWWFYLEYTAQPVDFVFDSGF